MAGNLLGIDWVPKQKALQNFVVACTGLASDHVVWGQQQAPRPTQAGIIMRLMMENDEGIPWIDEIPQYLQFTSITVTADDTTNLFTATGHGLLTGDGPVRLSGADLPNGTLNTVNYWIVKVSNDTFKLAESFQKAMATVPTTVDLLDSGSGVITLDDTDTTQRAGQELKSVQRSLVKMVLTLECYTNAGVGLDMAAAILWRVAARRLLPTPVQILRDANIGVSEVTRVRSYGGTQSQYLFEPRASMDITLYVVSEAGEDGGIIERAEITGEDTGQSWTVDVGA